MMKFPKPAEPGGFAAAVAAVRLAVEAQVNAGTKPSFSGREKWRDFKSELAAATGDKCAYCEVLISVDRFKGDVEHYRPKSRVDALEIADDGRKKKALWASGYWWLAYEWSNYLLSCNPCNSAHKGNFFPLDGDQLPGQEPAPGDEAAETPLLLHPFARRNPGKHLEFDSLGQVRSRRRSPFGRATIDVCGLDREPLRRKRAEKAELVHRFVDRLEAAVQAGEPTLALLEDIHSLGRADREHSGLARAVFEERTGSTWSWLEEQAAG